jgi:ABC-type antimicrobial peptide transport system permease subunit
MFTLPEILSVPVFSALGGGAVPTSGAVFAWMLIAAFVGSSLGVLREVLRGTARTRVANKRAVESHLAPVAPAHGCCEAA